MPSRMRCLSLRHCKTSKFKLRHGRRLIGLNSDGDASFVAGMSVTRELRRRAPRCNREEFDLGGVAVKLAGLGDIFVLLRRHFRCIMGTRYAARAHFFRAISSSVCLSSSCVPGFDLIIRCHRRCSRRSYACVGTERFVLSAQKYPTTRPCRRHR
jgi:hypothetical protein